MNVSLLYTHRQEYFSTLLAFAPILLHKMGENRLDLDFDWIICSINLNLVSFMQKVMNKIVFQMYI